MIVYAFKFTDCIYESAYATVSLHTTKLGAYKAMRKDKLDLWKERSKKQPFHNATKDYRHLGATRFCDWKVVEVTIRED